MLQLLQSVGKPVPVRQPTTALVIFLVAGAVCTVAWLLALHSKQQVRASTTTRYVPAALAFRPLDVVNDRILAEAISQNFFVFPAESGKKIKGDSAIQLLEGKGIVAGTEGFGFRTSIDFLQYLQLTRDLATEMRSIKTLVTLNASDLPEKSLSIPATGGGESAPDDEDNVPRRPLTLARLLWYIEHYYLKPVAPLIKTDQLGRASVLAGQAANRLRTLRTPLGQHYESGTRHRINQILLMEALLSDPSLWIAKSGELTLLIEVLQGDFSPDREFELGAKDFAPSIEPFKHYWLGVFAFRRADFAEARRIFAHLPATSPTPLMKELSRLMSIRSRYWGLHAEAKQKGVLPTKKVIDDYVEECSAEAKKITSAYLRQNVIEYGRLAGTDLQNPVLVGKEPLKKVSRNDAREASSEG
jgi:hypothetical protein